MGSSPLELMDFAWLGEVRGPQGQLVNIALQKWSSAVVGSVGTKPSLLVERVRTNCGQELCSPAPG